MPPVTKLRLEFTELAAEEYLEGIERIAEDSPANAEKIQHRVEHAIGLLLQRPLIGKAGRLDATREYPVGHTSLTLIYMVENDALTVLRVLHQRRDYP